MEPSILTSTKKVLGIDAAYTVFDADITTFINTAFSVLTQLGVGPVEGFFVEDDAAEWSEFVDDIVKQSLIKSYVFLKVRMLFDTPATSFLIAAYEKQIAEYEARISIQREDETWIPTFLV
jgi:hypothetical protein